MKTKERGITLIALVVTIIVLLILAGVSIQMLTGQSGILSQARQAKEETEKGQLKDDVQRDTLEEIMKNGGEDITTDELYNILDKYFEDVPDKDDKLWLIFPEGFPPLTARKEYGGYEIEIGEIYDGNLKEQQVLLSAEKMYENQIDYYGAYVDYPVDINGDGKTTNDWKIFYIEDYQGETEANDYYNTQEQNKPEIGKRIFLIAADYVGNCCKELTDIETGALLKSGLTQYTGTANELDGDCCYYWTTTNNYIYNCKLPRTADNTKKVCIFPSLFKFEKYDIDSHKEYSNNLFVSSLLCTENWSSFVKDKAEYAIGSPTIEMWVNSWNKHENKEDYPQLYVNFLSEDKFGYVAGPVENPEAIDYEISPYCSMKDGTGIKDLLYNPHYSTNVGDIDKDGKEEFIGGCWFAAIRAGSKTAIETIDHNGTLDADNIGNTGNGLRPVICLKSGVRLKEREQTDEAVIYDLIK